MPSWRRAAGCRPLTRRAGSDRALAQARAIRTKIRSKIDARPHFRRSLADEEAWAGRTVTLGDDAVLRVLYAMPRCVMLDHEQADLPPFPGLLRTVTDARDGCAGVVADVVRGGTVRIGDELRLGG